MVIKTGMQQNGGQKHAASLFVLCLKFLYYLFCFICVCLCVCVCTRVHAHMLIHMHLTPNKNAATHIASSGLEP